VVQENVTPTALQTHPVFGIRRQNAAFHLLVELALLFALRQQIHENGKHPEVMCRNDEPCRHMPGVLNADASARQRGKAARDSGEIGHHDYGGAVTCKR